jgi:hypothetical protein
MVHFSVAHLTFFMRSDTTRQQFACNIDKSLTELVKTLPHDRALWDNQGTYWQ